MKTAISVERRAAAQAQQPRRSAALAGPAPDVSTSPAHLRILRIASSIAPSAYARSFCPDCRADERRFTCAAAPRPPRAGPVGRKSARSAAVRGWCRAQRVPCGSARLILLSCDREQGAAVTESAVFRGARPRAAAARVSVPRSQARMMRRRAFLAAPRRCRWQRAASVRGAAAADEPFSRSVVFERARALAAAPFAWPEQALPDALANLSAERLRGDPLPRRAAALRRSADRLRGRADASRASSTAIPVEIFVVDGGVARKIAYDPALFNFGNVRAAGAGRRARVRRLPRA